MLKKSNGAVAAKAKQQQPVEMVVAARGKHAYVSPVDLDAISSSEDDDEPET